MSWNANYVNRGLYYGKHTLPRWVMQTVISLCTKSFTMQLHIPFIFLTLMNAVQSTYLRYFIIPPATLRMSDLFIANFLLS